MSAENAATLLDGTVKLIDALLDQARGQGYTQSIVFIACGTVNAPENLQGEGYFLHVFFIDVLP